MTETEQKNQVESLYSAAVKELYGLAFYTVLDIKAAEALTAGAFSDTFRILSDKADLEAFRIKAASCLYRSMKRTSKNPGYASGDSPLINGGKTNLIFRGKKEPDGCIPVETQPMRKVSAPAFLQRQVFVRSDFSNSVPAAFSGAKKAARNLQKRPFPVRAVRVSRYKALLAVRDRRRGPSLFQWKTAFSVPPFPGSSKCGFLSYHVEERA